MLEMGIYFERDIPRVRVARAWKPKAKDFSCGLMHLHEEILLETDYKMSTAQNNLFKISQVLYRFYRKRLRENEAVLSRVCGRCVSVLSGVSASRGCCDTEEAI